MVRPRDKPAHVAEVIADGEPPARKALVQEIRVVSRAEIHPFFNLPVARPPCGSVLPAGHNPNHIRVLAGNRVVLDDA